MQILYAAAALGGAGIVFGLLLAVAARVFAVKTDPRIEEVKEALPGANCGACGYAGCSGFAEAVVKGTAPIDGCIPGGSDTINAVACVLGQEPCGSISKVAVVFCIGDRDSAVDSFEYDGVQDCSLAQNYGGGFKACSYGCLGLGSCVKACPFDAIKMQKNGLPLVDEERCGGCGLCSKACPRDIIKILPKSKEGHLVLCNSHDRGKNVTRACKVGCTACTACVKACPQEAIAMENNLAVIDLDKCNDCRECTFKCRPGTIHARSSNFEEITGKKTAVSAGA